MIHHFRIPSAADLSDKGCMGKGYEAHQERLRALQALGKDLARRSKSKCELTGVSGVPLRPYEVPPVSSEPDLERTLLLSEACHEVLEHPKKLTGRGWQCLVEAVWGNLPAAQVVAWRMLSQIGRREHWARQVIDELMLDPEVEAWAKSTKL
jgi:protein PhnA